MALSGLPLLVSVKVGASSKFLIPQVTGLNFDPTMQGVSDALMRMLCMSPDELTRLGAESRALAITDTSEKWVDNLLALV